MSVRYCYLNGKFVSEKTAKVSVLDRGLLLGEGVFETMRAYNGRIFSLDRHLSRLRGGASALGIPLPSTDELRDALDGLMKKNKLSEARVRLTVTSGPGGPGVTTPGGVETTVLALAHPMTPPDERLYTRGATATILPMRKYASAPLVGIKTISYGENLLGRRLAAQRGVDEGIFLNTEGDICEGSSSNIFLVRYGRLYTPDLTSGCLPGITREVVLELAPAAGFQPVETSVTPIDLVQAEEAFVTSSTRELLPLVRVDGDPIGRGEPGQAVAALQSAYRRAVEIECGG